MIINVKLTFSDLILLSHFEKILKIFFLEYLRNIQLQISEYIMLEILKRQNKVTYSDIQVLDYCSYIDKMIVVVVVVVELEQHLWISFILYLAECLSINE